jgi:hypothetical protein
LPIVIYAIFDEEKNSEDLENNPIAYQQGIKSNSVTDFSQALESLFNTPVYWRWFAFATWQAAFISLIP